MGQELDDILMISGLAFGAEDHSVIHDPACIRSAAPALQAAGTEARRGDDETMKQIHGASPESVAAPRREGRALEQRDTPFSFGVAPFLADG
jgi:hypothetical protein